LKCGKSLKEVQVEIHNTLNGRNDDSDDASAPEIDEEEASFLKASDALVALAEKERATRKKTKCSNKRNENLCSKDLPILFDWSKKIASLKDCTARACDTCRRSNDTQSVPKMIPNDDSPNFRYFDKDEEDVVDIDINRGLTGKRQSRTALISIQKRSSARLLNEIFNDLTFIERYNNGFLETKEGGCSVDHNDDEAAIKLEQENSNLVYSNRRKGSSSRGSAKRARNATISDENSPAGNFVARFERLSHLRQMVDYDDVRRQHRISLKENVEPALDEIAAVLRREAVTLNRFATDESILAEEKTLNRAIRSYSRKADQEKIEKKEFSEKQQTLVRENDCFSPKRRRAQRRDWKEMESRLFCFVEVGETMPDNIKTCPRGISCHICSPVLHDEVQHNGDIFNPNFRMINDQDHYINHYEANGVNEFESRKLVGRVDFRETQKMASLLKLSELYHTFQFIASYNKGTINTRGT
jgi:hypothetical protein